MLAPLDEPHFLLRSCPCHCRSGVGTSGTGGCVVTGGCVGTPILVEPSGIFEKHQACCSCVSSTRSCPVPSPASTSLPTGLPETRGTDKTRSTRVCPSAEGRPEGRHESSVKPRPAILATAAPRELEPSAGAGMRRKGCGAALEARCVSLHPILSATHCHTCQSPPNPAVIANVIQP